jgi:SAM-dependent methyltransferase
VTRAPTIGAACTVCGGRALEPLLRRDRVPVHQNHPEPTRQAAREAARGDLHLDLCTTCGFIFNAAFDHTLTDYGQFYISDQTWSAVFDRYVDALVDRLLADGVRQKRIVEIGCGTGSFLERLCARGDNRGIGFDPAHRGAARSDDGRVEFVRGFFGPHDGVRDADVIVCRHVLGHIARPFDFLTQIRSVVGSRVCRFYFETPAVEWSLDNVVVSDFFYEYCSYFSTPPLTWLLRRTGFVPARATRVFAEQYSWLDGETAASPDELPPPSAKATAERVARYRAGEQAELDRCHRLIDRLRPEGPLAIWGAGAKGVTFLNLLDPDCARIAVAVDLNARKQGKFVAGTGHAIEGPAALAAHGIRNVIVMNPNYRDEIARAITATGSGAKLHA